MSRCVPWFSPDLLCHRTDRFGVNRSIALLLGILLFPGWVALGATAPYWKGNLHTHTLWSDGDGFPEMVADWYKEHGYQFLALSDHNQIQTGEKWVNVASLHEKEETVEQYRERFGALWVTERNFAGVPQVRLKTLNEFGPLLEEKDRFLFIPGTEITSRYLIWPVHVNASNVRSPFVPPTGLSVLDVMQRSVDMVLAQRAATGQPMIPHINHPNFGWAITAEDLSQLRGEKFFEVYNGHPEVHNHGDGSRLGVEQMWDIALALRLSKTKLGPLYALAVDDAHRYHEFSSGQSNPGRGWIMVRAPKLSANEIILAMDRGDFYASTGVVLRDVQRQKRRLSVEVEPEPGVTYKIRFIGTPKGFNPASEPILAKDGSPYPTTRKYRPEVGMLLQEVAGTSAVYEMTGNELYVRATVVSSRMKEQALTLDEPERAWTQPLVFIP